jgi:hypothetical protein
MARATVEIPGVSVGAPVLPRDAVPQLRRGWRLTAVTRLLMRVFAPVTIFPLVFFAQGAVGQELLLFPLHMIAVAQMAFEFGRRGAFIGVALATGLWIAGTYVAGWDFSNEWIRYANGIIRGLVCAFAAGNVLLLRRTIAAHRTQMEGLRALLDVCHGCGAVRGSDDDWVAMERLPGYAASRLRTNECPSCARTAGPANH